MASVAPLAAPTSRPAAPRPAAPPTASAPSWRAELERELVAPYSDPAVRLYRSGLADIRASRYPQGAVKLQELQHKFPKSELSEPAEYFCANALYESGKYDQSILQFNDLTMRFPNGRYATASLLREAQAFMKINDRIDARLTLQKLIGDHPNSPETPQARSMMQTLASG
jgi:TolA-binding protein